MLSFRYGIDTREAMSRWLARLLCGEVLRPRPGIKLPMTLSFDYPSVQVP